MEKLKSQNGFAVQRFSELMHLINSISYGNHQGKGIDYWCSFIKQCHVSSLIQLELKSMIKSNGHYAVQGVYYPLPKGRKLLPITWYT